MVEFMIGKRGKAGDKARLAHHLRRNPLQTARPLERIRKLRRFDPALAATAITAGRAGAKATEAPLRYLWLRRVSGAG